MSHLVSIIIPVYNTGDRLKRSVESVLNQTYSNCELVIIDDGSNDEITCDLLNKFEENSLCTITNKIIKVIHQPNKGVSAARNIGMDIANGDYFMFLDADDFFCDDAVEKNMQLANAYSSYGDIDIIMRDMQVFNEITGNTHVSDFFSSRHIYENKDGIDELISSVFSKGFFSNIAGGCYRTEFIRSSNVKAREDVLLCEDIDWNLKLMLRASKIVSDHEQIYTYCKYDRMVSPGIDRYKSQTLISEYWVKNICDYSRGKNAETAIINRFSDTFTVFSLQCSEMQAEQRTIAEKICKNHLDIAKMSKSMKSRVFYYFAKAFGVRNAMSFMGIIYRFIHNDTISLE